MTRQKFRRAHPPSAFALQFQNPQRFLAASRRQCRFCPLTKSFRLAGLFDNFRLPDFQQLRLWFRLAKKVNAPGHGVKARSRFQIVFAGRFQSMRPSSFLIFGAWLAPSAGCGCGWIFPAT